MAEREKKCVYRKEFIEELAWRTGMTTEECAIITASMLDIMASRLRCNQSITFDGFGTFEIRATSQRPGRNPQTMEDCVIAAGYKPVFRPSKGLRDAVTRSIQEGIPPEVKQNLIPPRPSEPGKRGRRRKKVQPPKGYPKKPEDKYDVKNEPLEKPDQSSPPAAAQL